MNDPEYVIIMKQQEGGRYCSESCGTLWRNIIKVQNPLIRQMLVGLPTLTMLVSPFFPRGIRVGLAEEAPEGEVQLTEDEDFLPAIPDDLTGGKPWADTLIPGNVTADTQTSAVEDFYLWTNCLLGKREESLHFLQS